MGHMNAASDFVWAPGPDSKRLHMSGSEWQERSLKKWNVKKPQKLTFGTRLLHTRLFLSPLKITTKKVCSQEVDLIPGNWTDYGAALKSIILYVRSLDNDRSF